MMKTIVIGSVGCALIFFSAAAFGLTADEMLHLKNAGIPEDTMLTEL